MAKTLMETIYGKFNKFEIFKDSGIMSTSFTVIKDGKFTSRHSSLADAVAKAKKIGKVD